MAKKKQQPPADSVEAEINPDMPLRLEWRSPAELAENPANWRRHPDEQISALTGAISEVGWAGACLYNERTGRLIDGHARRKVALEQGTEKVPVLIGDWSEEQEKKILATLDPLSAMAAADKDKLDALLRDVQTGSEGVAKMLTELAEQHHIIPQAALPTPGQGGDEFDTSGALEGECRVKAGDLWLIDGGRHRLICGDSTDAATVGRLMGGEKAVLMATDPPYGVNFVGAKYNPRAKEWDGIANDELQGSDLEAFLGKMFSAWLPQMDGQSAFYFWTVAMAEGAAAAAIRKAGLHIQSQIIWNKNCLVLGQADYHWKHENCWYAFWKGKKHRWYGERDKTTVWDVDKIANGSYEHPMQKPIELYAIPMRHHTQEDDLVCEPFAGSGSQFIAAHRLSRRCFGLEIEPKYAEIILRRAEAEGLSVSRAESSSDSAAVA